MEIKIEDALTLIGAKELEILILRRKITQLESQLAEQAEKESDAR